MGITVIFFITLKPHLSLEAERERTWKVGEGYLPVEVGIVLSVVYLLVQKSGSGEKHKSQS